MENWDSSFGLLPIHLVGTLRLKHRSDLTVELGVVGIYVGDGHVMVAGTPFRVDADVVMHSRMDVAIRAERCVLARRAQGCRSGS